MDQVTTGMQLSQNQWNQIWSEGRQKLYAISQIDIQPELLRTKTALIGFIVYIKTNVWWLIS